MPVHCQPNISSRWYFYLVDIATWALRRLTYCLWVFINRGSPYKSAHFNTYYALERRRTHSPERAGIHCCSVSSAGLFKPGGHYEVAILVIESNVGIICLSSAWWSSLWSCWGSGGLQLFVVSRHIHTSSSWQNQDFIDLCWSFQDILGCFGHLGLSTGLIPCFWNVNTWRQKVALVLILIKSCFTYMWSTIHFQWNMYTP